MMAKKMYILLLFFSLNFMVSAQTITQIDGLVEVRQSLNSAWHPATIGSDFNLGASLRTFSGNATITVTDSIIKLNDNTVIHRLAYYPQSYEVTKGEAYVNSRQLIFFVNGPLEIFGEAIFSASDATRKASVISGFVKAIVETNALKVLPGEQFVNSDGKVTIVKAYPEYPWYKGLKSVNGGHGVVTGFKGSAEILRDSWQAVTVNDILEVGQSIKTNQDSWLELMFADSLIRLQADTELSLKKWADYSDGSSQTVLELKRGKVWAIINNGGQPFEIETPGLIAGVRGTKFRLDSAASDSPPLIKTFEGVVAGVEEDKFTDIEEGRQFDPLAGLGELVFDDIDRFNLERDKQLNKPTLFVGRVDYITNEDHVILKGVSDADKVTVNGKIVRPENNSFTVDISLIKGMNYITVVAENSSSGSKVEIVKAIIRE